MKITKRNGQEIEFTKTKIENAIRKANASVVEASEQATDVEITLIAASIEAMFQSLETIPTVEEVQDTVEDMLMLLTGKPAKKYITYRFTRELARKANTTDDKDLSLLDRSNEEVKQENSNKNPIINSTQRDYMAGEVSKDLTMRILLPEEIVKAHQEGIIHFHDSDYYAQREHNCDLINLEICFRTEP